MVLIAKTGSMSSMPIEMKSDRPCSHQQESEMLKTENAELKAKIASLETEKEQSNNKTNEQIQRDRNIIASLIPRNLPQYRSDEDFSREVELRVSQLGEYCTIQDIKELMDAKIWKHSKNLAAKTASLESSNKFNFIHNPLSNIAGNSIVHSNNNRRNNNNTHTYDPIAIRYQNRRGRTASLGDTNFWYLDLFDDAGIVLTPLEGAKQRNVL